MRCPIGYSGNVLSTLRVEFTGAEFADSDPFGGNGRSVVKPATLLRGLLFVGAGDELLGTLLIRMVVLARHSWVLWRGHWVRVLAEEDAKMNEQHGERTPEEIAIEARRSGYNTLGAMALLGAVAMVCGGCIFNPIIAEDWMMTAAWVLAFVMFIFAIWAFSMAGL